MILLRNLRKPWLAALLGALMAGSGTVATALALEAAGPVREGDLVTFHVRAYDAQGSLLYATDEIPEGEDHEAGSNRSGTPRQGYVRLREDPRGPFNATLRPSQFLLGHRAGDVVRTPLIDNAFGVPPRFSLPRAIGPVASSFRVNLSELYDERNATIANATLGPREEVSLGLVRPYGETLQTRVESLEGDEAVLRVAPIGGGRTYSKVTGFNFTVEWINETHALLRPDLAPGEVFEARGCRLPLELPGGRYRVVAVDETAITVEAAPERLERVLGRTVRAEFQILEVRKDWVPADVAGLPGSLGLFRGGS